MTNMPRLVVTPRRIDQDALEIQIAQQQSDATELRTSVRSRTATMLSDLLEREKVLSAEHKELRAERARLQSNIKELQAIDNEYNIVDADYSVELQAVTQLIALLKSAGVTE